RKAARVDHYGDPLPPGAIARLGTLRLWHEIRIQSMAFSPDGKVLASSGGWWTTTYARLWDAATGKEIRRISGTTREGFEVVKFSGTGRLLAGVSPYGKGRDVFVWDAATGKLLHQLTSRHKDDPFGDMTWNLAFLDGDKTLVAVDAEGQVRWWDMTTGKKRREWSAMSVAAKPNGPGNWEFKRTYHATLTRDGRFLAAIVLWENNKADREKNKYRRHLIVWDLDRHKQLWRLADGDLFAFDLSADGKSVAVGVGPVHDVSIRDGLSGRKLRRLERGKTPVGGRWQSIALSKDGKTVAALSEGWHCLRLWDVGSGKAVHQRHRGLLPAGSSSPAQVFFSQDGKTLAVPWSYTVALWDVAAWTERPRRQGHHDAVLFLSFSADGKTLVSGNDGPDSSWSYPQTAVTWDTSTWKETARSELMPDDETMYVSRDHRLGVVCIGEGDYFVAERPSGKKLRQLEIGSKTLFQPFSGGNMFSPSGKTIVQIVAKPGPEYELALVDVASGKKRGTLPENAQREYLAFSPDDRIVAWIDNEAVVHVVRVDGGKELRRLGTPPKGGIAHSIRPMLAFSPDGRHLAFWERDIKDIVIWDWQTGKEHRRLPGRSSKRWYEVCLVYSPDGRCLAVGGMAGDHEVELWELASGQLRRRIPGHRDDVCSLAFSPDGRLLASGSRDTTILVWDLYGLSLGDRPAEKATKARRKALWENLAHADARKAGEAMTALIQDVPTALSLLAQKLHPVSAADSKKLARWVADLDSDEFTVREKATHELDQLAELAESALRKALAKKPPLEARRRIEQLLEKLHSLPPNRLRLVRAVEVLEHLRTPEARQLLKRLAEGAFEARLTREARASMQRLARTEPRP
ncbi:MAG: hypothetical protein ACRELF_07225, partial [Gemmataceae bacterium]